MAEDKLDTDPDFILLARFDNSLAKALERYPDGAPDHVIARALGVSEDELERRYQAIVAKLRSKVV